MTRPSLAAATKDSGVAWLGRLPANWGVVGAKRLFALRNSRAATDDVQLTASQAYGVIPQDEFIAREGRRVVQVIKDPSILKHVEPGDFVISMRSFQGGIERSDHRGCVSSAYVVLRPLRGAYRPFFTHLLKSSSYIQALQSTSDLVRDGQALRYENFALVSLPLVPLDEQKRISDYLDSATDGIDGLIDRKQRLVDLLLEKRITLISNAVTKGLDPNVEMKDSGVESLGAVPTHYEVRPFGKMASLQRGFDLPADARVRGPYPVVSSGGIVDHHARGPVAGPGVVTGRYGSVGAVYWIDDAYWPHNTALYVRDFWHNDQRFIYWLLLSLAARIVASESGKSAVPGLDQKDTRDLRVARPPVEQQRRIASFLDAETKKIDDVVEKTRNSIVLLREYRTALISAAVTGQLDTPVSETTEEVA